MQQKYKTETICNQKLYSFYWVLSCFKLVTMWTSNSVNVGNLQPNFPLEMNSQLCIFYSTFNKTNIYYSPSFRRGNVFSSKQMRNNCNCKLKIKKANRNNKEFSLQLVNSSSFKFPNFCERNQFEGGLKSKAFMCGKIDTVGYISKSFSVVKNKRDWNFLASLERNWLKKAFTTFYFKL